MTCQIFELIVKLVAKALFSENIWKISEAVYQTLEKQIVLYFFCGATMFSIAFIG